MADQDILVNITCSLKRMPGQHICIPWMGLGGRVYWKKKHWPV